MWSLADLERRFAQMVLFGKLSALDLSDATKPRCQVVTGTLETDWLPWLTLRAGNDSEFWAPEVGEQAVVISPYGDMAQGLVLVGIFQTALPAPTVNPDQHLRRYKDGAWVQYDRAAHAYQVDVPAGGSIVLHVGQTTLTLTDSGTTLATPALEVNSPETTFDGQVLVKKLLSYLQGLSGQNSSGGAATIAGSVTVIGGDVTVDGIGVKAHHHMAQGATAATTAAQD